MNPTIDLKDFGAIVSGILVVGAILKNAFPTFPNRFIPALTWGMGVLAYQIMNGGWTDAQVWLAAIIVSASATGIHSGVKNTLDANPAKPPPTVAGLFLLAICFGCLSCAQFTTTQTDVSYDHDGKPLRSITTRATAHTLFDSKSALASFKATQTDKTQSATVGSLTQESSSSGVSNAAVFLGTLIKAAQ